MAKPAVLVVDDDVAIAESIAKILEKTGKYHVLKAYSGKEALEAIEHHNKGLLKPDRIKLVLLDIILKPYREDDLLLNIEQYFKNMANVLKTQTMRDYVNDRNRGGKSSQFPPNQSSPEA